MVKGMSVAIMQGIEAEKKRISETLTIATKNLVIIGASITKAAGRSISAILVAKARAVNIGSGTAVSSVKG